MSIDLLKEDIQTLQFRRIYYIHGKELFLKNFYSESLKTAVLGDENKDLNADLDFFKENGKKLELEAFLEQTETFPTAHKYKLIFITDLPLKSPVMEYILKSPDCIAEDSVLILFSKEDEYDERTKDYKTFISVINKNGLNVEINALDIATKKKWVAQHFKKHKKSISTDTIQYLLNNTDNDMYMLYSEIEKLSAFSGERNSIVISDIDAVSIKTIDAKIYELTDSVLDKNMDKAYSVMNKLFYMNTNENILLASLFNSMSALFKIKIFIAEGLSETEIAKRTGLRDFIVKKHISRLKYVPEKNLCKIIENCAEADLVSKSASLDGNIIITKLIAECAALL